MCVANVPLVREWPCSSGTRVAAAPAAPWLSRCWLHWHVSRKGVLMKDGIADNSFHAVRLTTSLFKLAKLITPAAVPGWRQSLQQQRLRRFFWLDFIVRHDLVRWPAPPPFLSVSRRRFLSVFWRTFHFSGVPEIQLTMNTKHRLFSCVFSGCETHIPASFCSGWNALDPFS